MAVRSRVSSDFQKAGYASIETNASYVGGFVRQVGNFTFSRVFQAGHSSKPCPCLCLRLLLSSKVPFYQPETAYQIFDRVMFNQDVATGQQPSTSEYFTSGSSSAWTPSILPSVDEIGIQQCYLWDVLEPCTPAQAAVLLSGNAIVEDYILVGVSNGTTNAATAGTSP